MLKSRLAPIAVALVMLFAAGAARAGKQDFTLVNNTGVTIHKLFISASATNDWEENVLGADTLADGESLDISFDTKEHADLFDMRVEDSQGTAITWEKLKLTDISKVTLHFANGKATANVE